MKRGIITVGLGFGDEGKGAWVDFLCREYKADLVVRYSGGSQCGHNVQLPDGTRHSFSQYGAGTFAGANTYLGPNVIINPYALQKEKEALQKFVPDVGRRLLIHPKCLVSTIFHQWMNRLRELSRSPDPNDPRRHGSCGHGIGETRGYWLRYGEDAVFAEDLGKPRVLMAKLELLKQRLLAEAAEFAHKIEPDPVEQHNIKMLNPVHETLVLDGLAKTCMTLSLHVQDFETVVFEGAQGVLLDEYYGFHPYTTWSTVTPQHALEMAYDMVDECCLLGLTRTYMTRHGAGPLPTYNKDLTAKMTDPGNPFNPWQGDMRYGYLDIPLLRYAVEACGGTVDGVLVSHLDQCPDRAWGGYLLNKTTNYGEKLKLNPYQPRAAAIPNLEEQRKLGEFLGDVGVLPEWETVDANSIQTLITSKVGQVLGAANGPTHENREIAELPFRKKV